jgi:hypothetical protein
MSLELKIEALTAAVTALTAQLQAGNVAAPAPVAPAPAPVVQAAPVAAALAPAPVALLSETPGPVGTSMPAPPTFAAPVAAPTPTGAPFTDGKGLIDYVMGAYKALGPQKGALIQGVLTGLGYQNINDVKPEHYAALHTGVEALK